MSTQQTAMDTSTHTGAAGTESGDPVLEALDQAREAYLQTCTGHEQVRQALEQTRSQLAHADEARGELESELERARTQLNRLRRQVDRHRMRADQLAAALKDIHRTLFTGNLFELILKACLQITGGTRGVYVTVWGGDRFRARAAVDVDGYPAAEPSPFIKALCHKALSDGKAHICHDRADCPDLPAPDGKGETFRNILVAPVVLHKDLNGVVIVADKIGSDFDPDDAEMVLSIGDQASVAVENQRLQHDLVGAYFSIVGVLADAVEAKDAYTHGHCELVAHLARLTAERLGLSELEASVAFYGGLLHDIGKIGVSDGILNKPGRLTDEEWDLMRAHVRMGRELLGHVPILAQVSDVVLHHHERWDGGGYPDGLAGARIPIAARIVGAVDAYCAMVSKRSYKESMADGQARAELARCKGSHFDPAVVDALLAVLDTPDARDADPCRWETPVGLSHPADFRALVYAARGRVR